MPADPLTMPVGALMRPVETLPREDSLRLAAQLIREGTVDLVVVTDGPKLAGVITEPVLLQALAEGVSPQDPVGDAMAAPAGTIAPHATGAEALRLFSHVGGPLIVVDVEDQVLGVLAPSDLYGKGSKTGRLPQVGGMATPFGVYLTTGQLRGGAGDLALILTGASLFTLVTLAAVATELIVNPLKLGTIEANVKDALTIVLFLLGMRLIPLSGIHAAEHKVVHAIERGEELTPNIVKRMPRVHPRCGTNIAVAVSLFLGVSSAQLLPYRELQLLLAVFVTLAFWRPLGSLLQLLVTTRPPSDKHVASGIRAAEELLAKYSNEAHARPSVAMRIWYSGLPHVMLGSFLAYLLFDLILTRLGLPITV